MSKTSFQWNKSKSIIIKDKGFNRDFYAEMGKIFERHMYKYVPYSVVNEIHYSPYRNSKRYREGEKALENKRHLADSSYVSVYSDHATVTYRAPYARPQYRGITPQGKAIEHYTTAFHPLATSFWDKACWSNEKSQIGKELNQLRKRCVNNGG